MRELITHSGTFHADDVVATAILMICFPSATVIRTREKAELFPVEGRIIYDVGTQYNQHTHQYDHHQKGGAGSRPNGIPYASAGLIWKHFGEQCIQALGKSEHADQIWSDVDHALIQGVDAEDNGMLTSSHHLTGTQVEVEAISFGGVIHYLNEVQPNYHNESHQFDQAVLFAKLLITKMIERSYFRAQAATKLQQWDQGDAILILEEAYPWQEYTTQNPHILYVVYPTNRKWHCQAAPLSPGSFDMRKPLPQAWAGLQEEKLQKITGVPTAIFCHNNRFVSGAIRKEDAIQMAKIALAS